MKSILITGCNKGIGLGLVKALVKRESPPNHIIATCRDSQKAEELNEIALKNPNVHILNIDLKNLNTYNDFAKQVADVTEHKGLNVLVNNAGVTTKFSRIGLVKIEQVTENLLVNTVAPLMLTKACLPLLKAASTSNASGSMGISKAAIINISSILGSIHQNNEGGFYPYRMSKAALNAMTKSMSVDLKKDGILVVSLHPGWCKTDIGGKNAPLEVDTVVSQIVDTLHKLSEQHTGTFIQYDGTTLQW